MQVTSFKLQATSYLAKVRFGMLIAPPRVHFLPLDCDGGVLGQGARVAPRWRGLAAGGIGPGC